MPMTGIIHRTDTFQKRLLAVNPHLKMGAYREMDKKRFFELFNRERKLFSRYKKIHVRLEKNTETTEKNSLQKVSGENIWRWINECKTYRGFKENRVLWL